MSSKVKKEQSVQETKVKTKKKDPLAKKKRAASVLAIVLIVAMVVPTILGALMSLF